MSFQTNIRRATTVSGAVLALCLAGGGVAAADVLPLPLPSPTTTDPVSTVTSTVTSLSNALNPTPTPTPTPAQSSPSLLPSVPLPLPSSAPTPATSSPTGTTGGATSGGSTLTSPKAPAGTGTKTTVRRTAVRAPRVSAPSLTGLGAPGSRTAFPLADGPAGAGYAYSAAPSLSLPPVQAVSQQNDAAAPAVAPLLMAPAIQRVNPLAGITGIADHGGFPLRGVALALAVAAVGGLAFEHFRIVTRSVGG